VTVRTFENDSAPVRTATCVRVVKRRTVASRDTENGAQKTIAKYILNKGLSETADAASAGWHGLCITSG